MRLLPSVWLFVLTALALPLAAQRPVADAALDVYTPAAYDQERVAGLFSERVRANIEGYLEHADVKKLTRPFSNRSADADAVSIAEGAGLFLLAASESYDYSDDEQLKVVLDRVAGTLMRAQEKDGYLGLYDGDGRWGPGDVLTHAGLLLGFVAYWRSTGNDDAEAAARRMANLLIATFYQKRAPADAAALLPGVAELYRATGDARYLRFCRTLLSEETPASPLVSTLRGYGLVELFRITGDDTYLASARHIWQKMQDQSPSVTGVPSSGDHVNSCMTLAWFQLTLDLLRLTGQTEYASSLEGTIYNGLLAAQDNTTGLIDADVPLDGDKKFGHGVDVCSAAASVGIAELPGTAWGRYGYGIAIMNYVPGRASVRLRRRGSVILYSEGSYPATGSLLLHVEPRHEVRFPLRLFVPSWTKKFTADVGNNHLSGTPGQFLVINREWKAGDTVRISIDMSLAVIADPKNGNLVAVRRGPQLLALAESLNPDLAANLATVSIASSASAAKPDENTFPAGGGAQTYTLTGFAADSPQKLVFTPFADARKYRVWLQPHHT